MAILAVMVRYNTPLQQSETVRGMCEALAGNAALGEAYRFLIWDNSAEPIESPNLPIQFEYRHSRCNLGISGAGNEAMHLARARRHQWMLLLDQDTRVTAAFLKTMLGWSGRLAGRSELALVAPTVRSGGLVVSPRRYLFNRHIAYPDPAPGIAEGEAFAINSGSLTRVSALRTVGGFSNDFWLDYSDIYVCHQYFLHGYKLWRATDAELEHEMTVRDYDRLMTPARYINYSYAESAFNDMYKGRLENGAQDLRLLMRALRQRRRYKDPAYSRITLAQFFYRMRNSRERRIENWKNEGERRRARMTLNEALVHRTAS